MKILDVEVKRIDDDHLSLNGKVVNWEYDPTEGGGLFCEPVGWTPEDPYADMEEIIFYWLEAQARWF